MNWKKDYSSLHKLYGNVARAYLKNKKVFRYHLKKISDMDDRQVIQACHFWYEENKLVKDYQTFEALYFQQHREECLTVFPINRKDDRNE